MAEYLTTREVAKYLRLNEKKVYAMVSEGQLPASRISGKWLFPRHLVDMWVEQKTVYPSTGLMGAVLDEMVVMQGSDDWLLSRIIERFHAVQDAPVVSASVGSLAGLSAVSTGKAHVAGCHVGNDKVREVACRQDGCYLVNLFDRHQGLMFDPQRHPEVKGLESVIHGKLRFAERQPLSGTYRLVCSLFEQGGLSLDGVPKVGPFFEHMGVALAINQGRADAGVGIKVAADMFGLGFVPLTTETYKLAIPPAFLASRRMSVFLDFVLTEVRAESRGGVSGYEFSDLGVMETMQASAKA